MQPTVEIRTCGDRDFNASVGIGNGIPRYDSEGLSSVAECLRDAAAALGREFGFAIVTLDNVRIGSYPVAFLEHRAVEVADELLMKRFGECAHA